MDNPKLDDSFEEELASFQPRPVSPELGKRIGAELKHRRSIRWLAPLAGLAAAACLTIGFLIRKTVVGVIDVSRVPPNVSVEHPTTPEPSSPPTLMDYRRAFADSSEAFDALLARPAGGEVRSTPASDRSQAEPVRAFSLSSISLVTANGDLK